MRTRSWCSQNITSCLHPTVTLNQLGLSSGSKFAPSTSAEIICRESRAPFLPKGAMLPKSSILLTLNLLSRPWDLMLSDRTDNSAGVVAAEGGASGQPPLGSSQLKGSEKKVVFCLSYFWWAYLLPGWMMGFLWLLLLRWLINPYSLYPL